MPKKISLNPTKRLLKILNIKDISEVDANIPKLTDEEILILNSLLSDNDSEITSVSTLCQILHINENTLYTYITRSLVKLNGLNMIKIKEAISSIIIRDNIYNGISNLDRRKK